MHKRYGPGWHGKRGGWDGPPGDWPPGRGSEAWRGFGRRMAIRFMVVSALGMLALVAVGAVIATGLAGVAGGSRILVVLLTPLVLLVAAWLVFRYTARTWRPVRDLIQAAGLLADGDYSVRVDAPTSPALGPVVRSFNQMASRLEDADEQRRQLLADLGHELRTPLTVVRGEIEAMLDGVHPTDSEHLEPLLEEVGVMERLLEDLRTLSLAEAGALALYPEPTDVAALVSDVADSYRRTAAEQAVVIDVDADPSIGELTLDPVRIREVLTNLVVNALRAMPDGGVLRLVARRGSGHVILEAIDTGVGIPPDQVETVFERFQRGSDSRGSGLGLTISRDLVEAHSGTIEIESALGIGTTARIALPYPV